MARLGHGRNHHFLDGRTMARDTRLGHCSRVFRGRFLCTLPRDIGYLYARFEPNRCCRTGGIFRCLGPFGMAICSTNQVSSHNFRPDSYHLLHTRYSRYGFIFQGRCIGSSLIWHDSTASCMAHLSLEPEQTYPAKAIPPNGSWWIGLPSAWHHSCK